MSKNNPLIIAGSGRSGTTWIADVLAEANDLRPIFEPLNPFFIPETRYFANRYVRENDNEPELKRFLEKAFRGEHLNLWADLRCNKINLIPSISKITSLNYLHDFGSFYKLFLKRSLKYMVIRSFPPITKLIRANLMLDWIEKNFNAKIIYVIRHPGAVVASQIAAAKSESGFAWDYNGSIKQGILRQYTQDQKFREDYLGEYEDILKEKLSPVSGYTLIWCLENILPVYKRQKKKRYVFFYEDIIENPQKEFQRMIKISGLSKMPENSLIKTPSQQAPLEMKKTAFGKKQRTKWIKRFNQHQLFEMERILKYFNVMTYSAYEPMPISRMQNSL